MAPQTPMVEPASFPAGDTVQWRREFTDYPPSDGWELRYSFRGEKGDGKLDIVGTPDQQGYLLLITSAQSNGMRAGVWMWEAYAVKTGERYRVGKGSVLVTPNLAVTDFSRDLRSPAKKAYDNAMAAWEQVKLGKSVSLNGRVYTQHDIKDLILYVDRCKSDWANEQSALEQAGGDHPAGDPRKIYVRLGRDY